MCFVSDVLPVAMLRAALRVNEHVTRHAHISWIDLCLHV